MSVDFNESFFEQLGRSPEVVALVTDVTEGIAETARETGPKDTEDYVNGIEAQIKYQHRVVGLVVGTDPKTMLIEAKTGNLARALQRSKKR